MYINITGNKGNKDVYITQSYRKENGKTSSRIYKKLGKYNDLLEQFSGDEQKMMDWARQEAEKETILYNQQKKKFRFPFLLSHAFLWRKPDSLTLDICFYSRFAVS